MGKDGGQVSAFRLEVLVVDWVVLLASGVMESVWAIALGKSEGFTKLVPIIVFLGALVLSMAGLAYATKTLPMGTAYAVWTGIGASLTVLFGIVTGDESASPLRIAFLCGLIGCILGLKLVGSGS